MYTNLKGHVITDIRGEYFNRSETRGSVIILDIQYDCRKNIKKIRVVRERNKN